MNQQFNSNINTVIKNNLDKFISYFNLDIRSDSKKYNGICPIHSNGDNTTAFVMYKNTGIWFCNTHHCERIFSRYPFGFIKGILSSQKGWQNEHDNDKIAKDNETNNFIKSFIQDNNSIIYEKQNNYKTETNEKLEFIKQINLFKKNKKINDRENFKKNAIIPSEYYLKRNFSSKILEKYDVGILTNKYHQFYNRTVVPIYDDHYQYIIAYTSRSNFEKCLVCGTYHDFNKICPNNQDYNKNSKWDHSTGFKKEHCLYNFWFSKEYINKTQTVSILESPSSLWRLEEAGIHNGVALFGSSISKYQANLLKKENIKKVILATDNDEAGKNAKESIKNYLGSKYNYIYLNLYQNDIGDMSIEDIQKMYRI